MSEENKDPKDSDKKDNPGGTPSAEDIKNLQKVISEKDRLLKEAEAKLAEGQKKDDEKKSEVEKVIEGFKADIAKLTESVTAVQTEKTRQELAKTYPDILPDLLLGKSKEEVDKIVTEQRNLSKSVYGDSQFFRQPTYRDSSEVDAAIDSIKKDPKLSTMKKLELMRELKLRKNNI